MRSLSALAFLLVTLPSVAWAGEDELVLAVEPAYAVLVRPEGSKHGTGADASLWFGVSETIWLAASAGAFGAFSDAPVISEACGGIAIAFDVFRIIPFGEAMIGALFTRDTIAPSLRFAIGADYLISRTLAVGLIGRYRPLPDALGGDALVTAGLRITLRYEL
jgi:hypothetical protein